MISEQDAHKQIVNGGNSITRALIYVKSIPQESSEGREDKRWSCDVRDFYSNQCFILIISLAQS